MFTFHCVASPSTLVKFSSASSEYLKLVDSSTHDYNYWRNQCTGKLFNQQKKINHWIGGIPDRKPSEIDGNTSVQKGIGGSRGRYQGCPPWVQILSFSCSFWEIAHPPPEKILDLQLKGMGQKLAIICQKMLMLAFLPFLAPYRHQSIT